MKEITITTYECKFCEDRFNSEAKCLAHEKECELAPAMQTCKTCRHYKKKENSEKCWNSGLVIFNGNPSDVFCGKIKTWLADINKNCPMWEGR